MRNSTIKIKFAPCVECSKEGDERDKAMANAGLGLCLYHNQKRKASLKKKVASKAKGQGYLELYKQIWDERPHVSEVSGEPIKEFNVCCFMHLLNKNTFSQIKHDKRNIFLVLPSEHDQYDNIGRKELTENPLWKPVFDRRLLLLREIYGSSGKS